MLAIENIAGFCYIIVMKKKIPFDAWHRLIQTEDFLIPQWKGLLFWHNYHFRDFCQDFKYDYVIHFDTAYQEDLCNLQEIFDELDFIRIQKGGVC